MKYGRSETAVAMVEVQQEVQQGSAGQLILDQVLSSVGASEGVVL